MMSSRIAGIVVRQNTTCSAESIVRSFSVPSTSCMQQMEHEVDVHGLMTAGQPTPASHPYLLQEGDIQPGISKEEFSSRRKEFARRMDPGSFAIVGSSPTTFMSGIIPYPYRPNAGFQYLTGSIQPDMMAIIEYTGHFTLYCADPSDMRDTWTGALASRDACREFFGADEVHYVSELPFRLKRLVANQTHKKIYIDLSEDTRRLLSAEQWQHALGVVNAVKDTHTILSHNAILHSMRWKKSDAEIRLMRESANIAAHAMIRCMQATSHRTTEHELSALFEYTCRSKGAQRMAYPPVVGSGPDACTIHYSRNDKKLDENSMVLMDAGCEYYGYCSDVTRTWPVGGRFTGPMKDVYEAVHEAHQHLVQQCTPGKTLREIHAKSIDLLSKGLRSLACTSTLESALIGNSYRTFYPHSVGHWLGMDTHDCPAVSHDLPLEPNVTLTIEPGIYIPDTPKYGHFRGIGVRIEDDICTTETGADVLSCSVPTDIPSIERIMTTD